MKGWHLVDVGLPNSVCPSWILTLLKLSRIKVSYTFIEITWRPMVDNGTTSLAPINQVSYTKKILVSRNITRRPLLPTSHRWAKNHRCTLIQTEDMVDRGSPTQSWEVERTGKDKELLSTLRRVKKLVVTTLINAISCIQTTNILSNTNFSTNKIVSALLTLLQIQFFA